MAAVSEVRESPRPVGSLDSASIVETESSGGEREVREVYDGAEERLSSTRAPRDPAGSERLLILSPQP